MRLLESYENCNGEDVLVLEHCDGSTVFELYAGARRLSKVRKSSSRSLRSLGSQSGFLCGSVSRHVFARLQFLACLAFDWPPHWLLPNCQEHTHTPHMAWMIIDMTTVRKRVLEGVTEEGTDKDIARRAECKLAREDAKAIVSWSSVPTLHGRRLVGGVAHLALRGYDGQCGKECCTCIHRDLVTRLLARNAEESATWRVLPNKCTARQPRNAPAV